MATIFVNGANSKIGGGRSILTNFLKLLKNHKTNHKFIVMTPDLDGFREFACDHIELLPPSLMARRGLCVPIWNQLILPRLLHKLKVDVLFNLADMVVPSAVPQVYLFDWPYAVYPDADIWERMPRRERVYRSVKLLFFKKYLRFSKYVIAQTETMRRRLTSLYGISDVSLVGNAVSLDHYESNPALFDLPSAKYKLLYLTRYYPHKNIEVFLSLAELIRARNLPFVLVTTLERSESSGAAAFLLEVERRKLCSIIVNLGAITMDKVPSLFAGCDGLLMPTLMESFSGTYVEAMFHKKVIFTSDLDFARDVCRDAAVYFDPMSAEDILERIVSTFESSDLMKEKANLGAKRLEEMPSWPQVFAAYMQMIEKAVALGFTGKACQESLEDKICDSDAKKPLSTSGVKI